MQIASFCFGSLLSLSRKFFFILEFACKMKKKKRKKRAAASSKENEKKFVFVQHYIGLLCWVVC